MKSLLQRFAFFILKHTGLPTCLGENCECAFGWPCLDCDPTDTEETHVCPGCGREHYLAKEGQDVR